MSIEESTVKASVQDTSAGSPARRLQDEGLQRRLRDDTSWRARTRKFYRQFFVGQALNIVGTLIILLFLVLTVLGEPLATLRGAEYDPRTPNILEKLQGPSWDHWFGTDELGRDIFSRVIAGAKYSLLVALLILVIAVTFGSIVGAIAGFVGGIVDELLMRLTDMFLAFPALILAIAISASLGPSLQNVVIALSVVYWPWYARLVRAQVLSIKEREFVEAARASGSTGRRVLLRHIMPNAVSVIIIQMTLDVGYAILATAGLSFIGLGAQPPTPEWGRLITDGRNYFREAWWFITFPGLALTLTVLGFNLVGDGLRDYLDPRTRGS